MFRAGLFHCVAAAIAAAAPAGQSAHRRLWPLFSITPPPLPSPSPYHPPPRVGPCRPPAAAGRRRGAERPGAGSVGRRRGAQHCLPVRGLRTGLLSLVWPGPTHFFVDTPPPPAPAGAGQQRKGQAGTWIVPEMVAAYIGLHAAGHAHSVETWVDGELVGGLYCV